MENTVLVNETVKTLINEAVSDFTMKVAPVKDSEKDGAYYMYNVEALMRTVLVTLINNRCDINVQTVVVKCLKKALQDLHYGTITCDQFKDKMNQLFETGKMKPDDYTNTAPSDVDTSDMEPVFWVGNGEPESEITTPIYDKPNIMDKLKQRVSNTQVDLINSCKTELESLLSTLDRFNNVVSTEFTATSVDTMLPEYIIGLCADEQEILKETLSEYKIWLEVKLSLSDEDKLGDHNILGALANIIYTLRQLILFVNKFTDPTTSVEVNKETEICVKCISEAINLGDVAALATDYINENPFIINDMILSTSLCVDLIINILTNIKSSIGIVSNAGINLVTFSKMITVCSTLNNYILDNVDLECEE